MKKYLPYLLIAFLLLPFFQYQLNPDGGSYISIAQKYASGNFHEAINGFWSPLYSWLLIPFLWLKLNPLLSAKFVNILAGLIGLIGVNHLLKQFRLSSKINLTILFLASIFFVKCALIIITPDLLLTSILIWYLVLLEKRKYYFAAIFGALAYFTKAYAFYFFLGHFLLTLSINYFEVKTKKKRWQTISQTIFSILLFLIISSIWIFLISNKYRHFLISNAGSYNYISINPYHWGPPLHNQGLLPPSNSTAISAWEDPSYHHIYNWNLFQNKTTFIHQLLIVKNNITELIERYQAFSILSLLIIITFILKIKEIKRQVLNIFLTIIIYPLGYLPLLITDRYLWFCELLILILGGILLDSLLKQPLTRIQKKLILIFFILIFIKPQLSEIRWYFNSDKNLYQLSQSLKNNYRITNARIAAMNDGNDWNVVFTIAYYTQNKYYGMIQKNAQYKKIKEQLDKYKINYFFVYGLSDKQDLFNKNFLIVYYDKKLDLTVYRIN